MKRNYILLTISLASLLAWRLFSLYLSNDKVDWFLFYDLEQEPKWYVFYTTYYLREMIYLFVIVTLTSQRTKELAIILLIIASIRLIIYWLFRGSQNLEVPIYLVLGYASYKLIKWPKYY